ncbi:2-C-methyl-D-erythritol 4-phosphate cytidylyltransferase [Anaerovibrio lipolyticus]|uniref:IspD/TarI family cytidylyltransferase n=1 Tax=Anaerovibrio lipolyticus TaxID=82374 RepID=UPI003AF33012|nr:2-C-methyl-D-erythritol 4-phosphate cytidylyltransferase [Anaerovibrio lipolyticus]
MHGKPVLIYTLQHFQEHKDIDKIVLVYIKSWIDYAHKVTDKYHIDKLVSIVPGGSTGQESIMHGILLPD